MNKEKFVGRLVIALVFVMIAAIAGEVRRMSKYQTSSLFVVRPNANHKACPMGSMETQTQSVPEVLVRFKPSMSAEDIDDLADSLNDVVEDRIEAVGNLTAIDDLDNRDPAMVAAQYRELPEVLYAEPNFTIKLEPVNDFNGRDGSRSGARPYDLLYRESESAANDPMFADQWALDNTGQRDGSTGVDVRAVEAWKTTQGSRDVVIAVIDTGVNYAHPDLADNMWVRPANVPAYTDAELGEIDDRFGFNAVDNMGDPMDDNGHGSHCAGIIGAVGNNNIGIAGINWQVQIMPLKFLSRTGSGTLKDAVESINYVIERRKAGVPVSVISASWGSTQKSKALEDVIKKASDAGILFIAASGNSSANADRRPHYPSNYPGVLSVAALNRFGRLASFSNYGAKTVHVAAPGAEIISTWLGGDYFEASGTSMATPYVAGVAGLVLAENPDFTTEELRARLLDTVDKGSDLTGKVASGGRINAARAVAGK